MSPRTAARMQQLGVFQIALSIIGALVIQRVVVPGLALAGHVTLLQTGVMFIAFGLIWHQLSLGPNAEKVAFWALVLGSFGNFAAHLTAAFLGIGGSTLTIAGAGHIGSDTQEMVFKLAATAVILCFAVGIFTVAWGARGLVASVEE